MCCNIRPFMTKFRDQGVEHKQWSRVFIQKSLHSPSQMLASFIKMMFAVVFVLSFLAGKEKFTQFIFEKALVNGKIPNIYKIMLLNLFKIYYYNLHTFFAFVDKYIYRYIFFFIKIGHELTSGYVFEKL